MGRVRLHGSVLNHRHEVSFFDDKIGFSKALCDVAGAQLEVLGDIGVRSRHDEIDFAIFGKVFVDRDRARLTGFLRVGIDRQIFVFDFDQFDRGLSDVFIFRRYRCHGFADVAHFALSEKRFVLDRLAVGPGRVFACHYRNHAGELLGLLRMDLFYFGVGFGTEESLAVEHVGQHEIVAVNNLPRDFFVGIDPGNRFSDDCEIRHLPSPERSSSRSSSSKRSNLFRFRRGSNRSADHVGLNDLNGLNLLNVFISYHRRRILHRLDDLRVTCATAEIARECVTNFILGRVLILVEQRLGHHQHSRGAVTALGATVLDERFLNRVQLGADLQSLDGDDIRTVELAGKNQAGVDRFTVQKNRAGAAVAGAAAFFGPGRTDLIAQKIEQKTMVRNFAAEKGTV